MKKRILISWSLYDFASSAFAAVMQTFLLPAYFVREVYQNEVDGAAVWGLALGAVGFLIALSGPIVGTLADLSGGKKRGIALFAGIAIVATAAQFFVLPVPEHVPITLLLFGVAALATECAFVLYNSILADIAPPNEIGKWSGYGWGLGYFGGMGALLLCLLLTSPEYSWFSHVNGLDVRVCFLAVAAWFTLFALPLFIFVPTKKSQSLETPSILTVLKKLYRFLFVEKNRDLITFFVARMFYIDGLITLFAFGGIYATAEFQFDERDVLLYGVALNVTAALGSMILGWLDDKIGPYALISFSLLALMGTGILILFTTTSSIFWGLSLILGFFIGPVQSASRSFLAKMAPPERRGELFGFFSLSGKATSFMGPFIVSLSIAATSSLKGGMGAILCFFAFGYFLLHRINIKKRGVNNISSSC